MIVRSSIARFALVSLLPVAGQANEALKLLEQEADSSKNIYEEAAELAVPRKDVKVAEEKVESVDPFLSERWGTELDPKFPIQAGRETRVAPRGLFEYQHQDRSVGGGTKLGRARVGAAVETLYGIELRADALLVEGRGWGTAASVPVGQSARLHVGKLPPRFPPSIPAIPLFAGFPRFRHLQPSLPRPARPAQCSKVAPNRRLEVGLVWFRGRSKPAGV